MEQFKYLHFDAKPSSRRLKDNEASVQFRCNGATCYTITLNQIVSNELRDKGFKYAKVRVDNFTGDAFVVFVKEDDNDTLHLRFAPSKDNCNAQIVNKNLVSWLFNWYGVEVGTNTRKTIVIGENLSHVENVMVFKLNKTLIK